MINCEGDSSLIEEYPRLNFKCFADIKNKEKFLKNFLHKKKFNKDSFGFEVQGSLNLINKKINFEKINIDNKRFAKEEDIVFFKESFERMIFDENFFGIFNIDKINKFLLEVI